MTRLAAALLAVSMALIAAPAAAAGGAPSARDRDALAKASLIYVATVRKDGNQSTAAPVWFSVANDGAVLVQTGPKTWKAKRIARGSHVIVWIGDAHGPAFVGRAEITKDASVIEKIVEDFPKRYMAARMGFHKPTAESFTTGDRIAIRITPTRDLPDGFTSDPGKPAPQP